MRHCFLLENAAGPTLERIIIKYVEKKDTEFATLRLLNHLMIYIKDTSEGGYRHGKNPTVLLMMMMAATKTNFAAAAAATGG